MNDYTYIYTLSDPITGNIRYIGKTNNLRYRIGRHVFDSIKDTKTHKRAWIKSLLDKGLKPNIEILDIVLKSEWEFWEKFYINLFKIWGFNLLNLSEGGESGSKTIEHLQKMVQTRMSNNSYKHTEHQKMYMSEKFKHDGNPFFNKTHTKETKEKIGNKSKTSHCKKVINIVTNQIFDSVTDAAKYEGVNPSVITVLCKKNKRRYKYLKNYEDELSTLLSL